METDLKERKNNGNGLGAIVGIYWFLAAVVDIWLIIVVFKFYGILAGILTILLPILSWIYWIYVMLRDAVFLPLVISEIVLLGVGALLIIIGGLLSRNE